MLPTRSTGAKEALLLGWARELGTGAAHAAAAGRQPRAEKRRINLRK